MVRRVVAMMLIALLTTTGCTVSFDGHTGNDETLHAKAPTNDDGVEVWDLRTPPSAVDVGMPNNEDYVAYTTKDPRTVRFLLPHDKVLETRVYLVVFDRIMYKDPANPTRPTGMDLHTDPMPLRDAYDVMGRSLKAFGLDTGPVDRWRTEIEDRPATGPSANLRIEGGGNTELGYLDIGVGGEYDPTDSDGLANIRFHLNLYGH